MIGKRSVLVASIFAIGLRATAFAGPGAVSVSVSETCNAGLKAFFASKNPDPMAVWDIVLLLKNVDPATNTEFTDAIETVHIAAARRGLTFNEHKINEAEPEKDTRIISSRMDGDFLAHARKLAVIAELANLFAAEDRPYIRKRAANQWRHLPSSARANRLFARVEESARALEDAEIVTNEKGVVVVAAEFGGGRYVVTSPSQKRDGIANAIEDAVGVKRERAQSQAGGPGRLKPSQGTVETAVEAELAAVLASKGVPKVVIQGRKLVRDVPHGENPRDEYDYHQVWIVWTKTKGYEINLYSGRSRSDPQDAFHGSSIEEVDIAMEEVEPEAPKIAVRTPAKPAAADTASEKAGLRQRAQAFALLAVVLGLLSQVTPGSSGMILFVLSAYCFGVSISSLFRSFKS